MAEPRGEPRVFTQKDFDQLADEVELTIWKKGQLESSFANHNVLDKDFVDAINKKRTLTKKFEELFRTDQCTSITYCWNIKELFVHLEQQHNPKAWRLFIDRSNDSLKAVLVHVAEKFPSIPIAYARNVKETYANLQAIIILTQYYEYKWLVCGDLKTIAILMGIEQGYMKDHKCFLCKWEGRKHELNQDYTEEWPNRIVIQLGRDIPVERPLVRPETNLLLSPLHVKIGLIRNFTRTLPRDGEAYEFLIRTFVDGQGANASKIGNGKFTRAQIRDLMRSMLMEHLQPLEKAAWEATVDVFQKFLGYNKADDYEQLVQKMINAYKEMGVPMSLKIHLLAKHLSFFPKKPYDCSDELAEQFFRDIDFIDRNYEGVDPVDPIKMLGSYTYMITHEKDDIERRRKMHRRTYC